MSQSIPQKRSSSSFNSRNSSSSSSRRSTSSSSSSSGSKDFFREPPADESNKRIKIEDKTYGNKPLEIKDNDEENSLSLTPPENLDCFDNGLQNPSVPIPIPLSETDLGSVNLPKPFGGPGEVEYKVGYDLLYKENKLKEALSYFEQAARKEHPAAYLHLFLIYEDNTDALKGENKSRYWYEKASKKIQWFID